MGSERRALDFRRWIAVGVAHRHAVAIALACLSFAYVANAVAVLVFGGYSFDLRLFEFRSHDAGRDLLFAGVLAVGAGVAGGVRARSGSASVLAAIARHATWIVAVVATVVLLVGILAGTNCACGADSYGYVSQAVLWTRGRLHVPEPLARTVPWPRPERTLAPLGYRPATYPGALVPTYAPGLPMTMALAMVLSRTVAAAFAVVPALGALAIWCTFLVGRRLHDPVTGVCAAVLLACSPTFLFHLLRPMSDVAVTAWWLAATVFLFRAMPLMAGLACSIAVLTRPNLVPLDSVFFAAVVAIACRRGIRSSWRSGAWFVLGALPGPIAIAWIQHVLYGSAITSGYGDLGALFGSGNIWPNARLYAAWLWQAHGPWLTAAFAAPVVWLALGRSQRAATALQLWFALTFFAVLLACYLSYAQFDNWTFTRFLLPAIPLLIALGLWAVRTPVSRLGPIAEVVLLFGIGFVAADWLDRGRDLSVFESQSIERRYIAVARFVGAAIPENVLLVAVQHTASLHYYAGRDTVRYDWIEPDSLDRIIEQIHAMGRGPLIVVDDWEEDVMRRRFAGQKWGALDWPAAVEFESRPAVRIFDPLDRGRYRSGQAVNTARVPKTQWSTR